MNCLSRRVTRVGCRRPARLLLGLIAACLLAAAAGPDARARVRLPAIFSDHLILQRGVPVTVWGWAEPGEAVTVSFAGQKRKATAGADGRWSVRLGALAPSDEPRDLAVAGAGPGLTLRDVRVGEVWLAGGQSNMHAPLFAAHNAAEAVAGAGDERLRLFTVGLRTAEEPRDDVSGRWQSSSPESAREFSAVGYFFARELRKSLGCPVGIINASWGGTPIQTWISLAGLERDPPLAGPLGDWHRAVDQYRRILADPSIEARYAEELQRWTSQVEPAYTAATKAYDAARAAGRDPGPKPQPAWPEPQNPDPMGMPSPSRRPQTPTVSFNGMIAPLAPFAVRGILWYQGEANGGSGLAYRALLPRLIEDWRALWGEVLPFLYVQLPGWGRDPGPVAEHGWPWTREAQFLALRVPRTAMAVTIDVGDPANVHPADKLDVGRRLALLARREVYGEKLVAAGPLFRGFAVEGSAIRVFFRETGSGLAIGRAPWLAPAVEPLPGDHLVGFFISGANRSWFAASARIDGDSVLVSSPGVPDPVAVRYGWASSPRCNLYNREGLPASPFRTDDWPK